MGAKLQGIGVILIILAVVDFIAGNFLSIDFTGVAWSPIALGLGGSLLSWIGSKISPDKDVADDDDKDIASGDTDQQ